MILLSRLTGWSLSEVDDIPAEEFGDYLEEAAEIAKAEQEATAQAYMR